MKTQPTAAMLLAALCALPIGSCAVVESQVVPARTAMPSGIPYFLPRRPFVVTVTGGEVPTISVTPGSAEPDVSQQFVLAQGTNLLADNEFSITVGPNGLLMTSASVATSEVAETVQGIAVSAGMLSPIAKPWLM